MATETLATYAVMEGKGSYNRHTTITADGAALAVPFLERALHKISLDSEERSVVVADYGSSQGKNSLAPMQIAVRKIRERIRPDRGIFVFHIDQPSNDFNSVFEVLSSDPNRYALGDQNVFPCAIGRSFYEQVLPRESVDLGWSSYAAVWLSHVPALIPGHCFFPRSEGAARAAFEKQGAEDWKAFLTLRACEMRRDARLIVVLPAFSEHGSSRFPVFMDQANRVLGDMVDEGAITAEERSRMALGAYPRRKSELLAPFANDGQFEGLVVEEIDEIEVIDRAWADYQLDGDKETLARKKALFFGATFMPSLALALSRVREGDAEALQNFADRLQEGLIRRLIDQPTATDMLAQIMVVTKSR